MGRGRGMHQNQLKCCRTRRTGMRRLSDRPWPDIAQGRTVTLNSDSNLRQTVRCWMPREATRIPPAKAKCSADGAHLDARHGTTTWSLQLIQYTLGERLGARARDASKSAKAIEEKELAKAALGWPSLARYRTGKTATSKIFCPSFLLDSQPTGRTLGWTVR